MYLKLLLHLTLQKPHGNWWDWTQNSQLLCPCPAWTLFHLFFSLSLSTITCTIVHPPDYSTSQIWWQYGILSMCHIQSLWAYCLFLYSKSLSVLSILIFKVFERIVYHLFYYKINFESPIWIPPEVLHPTVTSDFSNKNLKLSQWQNQNRCCVSRL